MARLQRAVEEASRRRRAEGDITPGGLLLAANMRVRTNPAGGGGPLFFGLRLGAEQLLGVRGTWEAVRERLSRYSLAQVLDILGRVSAVLAQGQSSRDIQHRLLLGLFDDAAAARILAAIERQAAQLKKEGFGDLTTVMFDELQIVNTAKAALLTRPADGADVPDMSFAALGEVFLMVSDLIEEAPGSLGGVDIHTDEGWQTALQYLLVNSLFHHSQHELHVLARCHDLYLQDKPRLAGCGSYVDLPALVRSATGLGPDALWAVLFAILGHTISQGARPEQAAPISPRRSLTS